MHLFTRTSSVNPERAADALGFALEARAHVSSVTGLDFHAWETLYGRPVGTLVWSTAVDSLTAMNAAREALFADQRYLEMIASSPALFAGPPEDSLAELLHSAGPGNPVGAVVSLVTAQCAGGHFADAISWGLEMTEHAAEVTGSDMHFIRGLFGPFGLVGWVAVSQSMEAYDAGQQALAADTSYLSRIDKAGEFFVPGSASTTLSRRLD